MIEVITIEKFKSDIFDFTQNTEWKFDQATPIVLNFTASWCGPCQMFAPTLEKIASEKSSELKVYKIDIDKTPELAALFEVKSVPTTLFISAGQDPVMTNGLMTEENLQKAIQEIFVSPGQ